MVIDVKIPIDTCLFLINNKFGTKLNFYSQLEECLECPLTLQTAVNSHQDAKVFLSTRYRQIIQIKDELSNKICSFDYASYKDQAIYRINLKGNDLSPGLINCTIDTIDKGRENIWPLVILLSLILSFACFNIVRNALSKYISKRRSSDLIENQINRLESRLDSTIKHSNDLNSSHLKRSHSVDAFRGIVILMMIFVNYGAGGYVFLDHAPWFGLTIADVIFPAFLFLMGTSIGFSLKSLASKEESLNLRKISLKIVKRSIILFIFGLIVNTIGNDDLSKLRIPGVLQRFAICYLIMALLHLYSLAHTKNSTMNKFLNFFYKFYLADIYPFYLEWLFMIVITMIYLYFTLLFNYKEGCEIGYQGPGGLHKNASQINCTGGAARQIDVWLFSESHIYQFSTSKEVYENELNHDPEGLLGTIGSLLVVFFGLQVAKIQISFTETRMKITRLFFHFFSLGTLALILHFTGAIPICKNLWSLSFVFITTSISYLVFIALYFIIEIKGYWNGQPFRYAGQNALLFYLGHMICGGMFPFTYSVDKNSHYLLLMRCSIATFVWLLIGIYLGRKKIIIKI